ncbi:piggyBac transposable element-derived protein 4-like [Lineus longissimus]|uniref:piggyBac transposable element-derived protein 4-like n=1 Tax=Lineus longissimus TaxID=88925 RepID=UPI00315D8F6B
MRPITDMFLQKFRDAVSPTREISLDEGTCAFKGRVSFRVYNKDKPEKWGIKLYEVCESKGGYCFEFEVFTGRENQQTQDITYHTVMRLCDPYLDKGHILYMDRYYSSPKLYDELWNRGTVATGTVMANRKGLSPHVKDKLRNKGDIVAWREGSLLCLKWKDRKDVLILSTQHNNATQQVMVRAQGGRRPKQKPVAIQNYNDFMSGVDLSDQMMQYYAFKRKTLKWWKKLFFHMIYLALVNARCIYNKLLAAKGDGKVALKPFLEDVCEQLVESAGVDRDDDDIDDGDAARLVARHFPSQIPPQTRSKSPPGNAKSVLLKPNIREE